MRKAYIKKTHIIIEVLAIVCYLCSLILSVVFMVTIKEPIPTHYLVDGSVDGYGGASSILTLNLVMLFVIPTLSVILHLMPVSAWNMPFRVKPERSIHVYGCMAYMLVIMECIFAVYLLAITVFMGLSRGDMVFPLSMVMLGALTVDIVASMIFATKKNK